MRGDPGRVADDMAGMEEIDYVGTSMGALAITGLSAIKTGRRGDPVDPVVQLAPPLACTQEHLGEVEQILRSVLAEAWTRI